jgi:hypothetical protein
MTITNAFSASIDAILTGYGSDLVSTSTGNSSVTLIYNSTIQRWVVIASSGMQSGSSIDWHITGNATTNDPAAPATYGTSTIAANENWVGTTDANDWVIGTNNIERVRVKQSGATSGYVGVGTAAPLNPFEVFARSDINKGGVYSYVQQVATGIDYNNRGVVGIGRGGNAGWGYGTGVVGVGDQANSFAATGVYALLGTNLQAAPAYTTDQALYADGRSLGSSAIFMGGRVGIGTITPSLAHLQHVGAVGNTMAMFGGTANSQGISLVNDWPGIYFNCYFNGSVLSMASSGYPSIVNTDQSAGGITFSTTNIPIVAQNATVTPLERMRVTGAGLVGIGIVAPVAHLDVLDASVGVVTVYRGRNSNATGTVTQIGSIEYFEDQSSTIDFTGGSNFSINLNAAASYNLQLANNSAAKPTSNAWTVASDARLKEDVTPFKDGLQTLKDIKPVYFKYTGKAGMPKEYGVGVIAQEIKEVAPYTVGTWEYLPGGTPIDENTHSKIEQYYSVDNGALTYVTINAVKELDEKLEKVSAAYATVSDFGVQEMKSNELFVAYSEDFKSKLQGQPIVTITPLSADVSLYISQQDGNGFYVKYNGVVKPTSFNWVAMAKVQTKVLQPNVNYTEEERQKMLSKVVIAPAKIKLQKELDEIQKRKNEKAVQDALDQKRDQEMKSRMQKDNRVEEEQRLKSERDKNR